MFLSFCIWDDFFNFKNWIATNYDFWGGGNGGLDVFRFWLTFEGGGALWDLWLLSAAHQSFSIVYLPTTKWTYFLLGLLVASKMFNFFMKITNIAEIFLNNFPESPFPESALKLSKTTKTVVQICAQRLANQIIKDGVQEDAIRQCTKSWSPKD